MQPENPTIGSAQFTDDYLEPIKVPENITLADLYLLLIRQNQRMAKFEKKAEPIIEVYHNWLTWKRGIVVWLGVLLAIGGVISTVQTIWALVASHIAVK